MSKSHSDVVIDFLADDQQTKTLLDSLAADGIAVSIISYIETYQGVIERVMQEEQQREFELTRYS